VRPEGLRQLKKKSTLSELELATFRLAAFFLLFYLVCEAIDTAATPGLRLAA
jgi:hypothetical protein